MKQQKATPIVPGAALQQSRQKRTWDPEEVNATSDHERKNNVNAKRACNGTLCVHTVTFPGKVDWDFFQISHVPAAAPPATLKDDDPEWCDASFERRKRACHDPASQQNIRNDSESSNIDRASTTPSVSRRSSRIRHVGVTKTPETIDISSGSDNSENDDDDYHYVRQSHWCYTHLDCDLRPLL
jgi:hypothetical protein